jgi:hypothetical protein
MTPTRALDTQRLSTLAHAFERDMVKFLLELSHHPDGMAALVLQEMQKGAFDEVFADGSGNPIGRIGSGKSALLIDSHLECHRNGRVEDGVLYECNAGIGAALWAAKLIYELGMRDDFTLWIGAATRPGDLRQRPESVILTEPTGLRIQRGERGRDVLTRAAIATYEELFELPPVIGKSAAHGGGSPWTGIPTIGFGPGENGRAPLRQIVNAAEFYAIFPLLYVDTVRRS